MDTQDRRVFRFGPFEADLDNRQLFKNGLTICITGHPFDILALLLENQGKLVTRQQLRSRLWPSGIVVDFDHGIHVAVTKLREALGDDAERPRFIATVPRHGYRFIAPVSTPASAALEVAATRLQPSHAAAAENATEHTAFDDQSALAPSPRAVRPFDLRLTAVITGIALVLMYVAVDKYWTSRHSAAVQPVTRPTQEALAPAVDSATAVAFNPPPHSIAVLPFVNLSGDKEQEYFSDGLTEELLNSLSHIDGLQVAARTSSFSFREHPDIGDVAHKLNVASVLEGSVRRAGNRIRITAQLSNAVTGFHLWSQTYDRDLSHVLQLQTEIANAVANALKVKLLDDVAAKIELGGTRNPAAFEAYLRASKAFLGEQNDKDLQAALSEFAEAIHQDHNFAIAYAARSLALARFARNYAHRRTTLGAYLNKAQADARKAIALAPDLADGHVALAKVLAESLEFIPASQEYDRALAFAPGDATVLRNYGVFAVLMGRTEAGLAATRRAVVLDPFNSRAHLALGYALNIAGRYADSVVALRDAKTLDPNDGVINAQLGYSYCEIGDYQNARAACEQADEGNKPICLEKVYEMTGRHADAEATLAKLQVSCGDDCAGVYADIYLSWGDTGRALDWLETAMRMREPYLVYLKTDRKWDPVRKEPRFRAIERAMKFPD